MKNNKHNIEIDPNTMEIPLWVLDLDEEETEVSNADTAPESNQTEASNLNQEPETQTEAPDLNQEPETQTEAPDLNQEPETQTEAPALSSLLRNCSALGYLAKTALSTVENLQVTAFKTLVQDVAPVAAAIAIAIPANFALLTTAIAATVAVAATHVVIAAYEAYTLSAEKQAEGMAR